MNQDQLKADMMDSTECLYVSENILSVLNLVIGRRATEKTWRSRPVTQAAVTIAAALIS